MACPATLPSQELRVPVRPLTTFLLAAGSAASLPHTASAACQRSPISPSAKSYTIRRRPLTKTGSRRHSHFRPKCHWRAFPAASSFVMPSTKPCARPSVSIPCNRRSPNIKTLCGCSRRRQSARHLLFKTSQTKLANGMAARKLAVAVSPLAGWSRRSAVRDGRLRLRSRLWQYLGQS